MAPASGRTVLQGAGESKGRCRDREIWASPLSHTAQAAVSQVAKTQTLKNRRKVKLGLSYCHEIVLVPSIYIPSIIYAFKKQEPAQSLFL